MRWWNGIEWADRYAEAREPASTKFARLKIQCKVAIIVGVGLVGAAVLTMIESFEEDLVTRARPMQVIRHASRR